MAFADETAQDGRLRLFLAELAVLAEQYGLVVQGCGECGSPWVRDLRDEDPDPDAGVVGLWLDWQGGRYLFRQGAPT